MEQRDRPWSVPVIVANIPDGGAHYELVADAAVREVVARAAGLRDVLNLEAIFDLTRRGDNVAVKGEVRARVGQTCVVTLEPIESDVDETVDLVFAPPAAPMGQATESKRKKDKGEPPEALENGVIDLGVVATEFLILGLDPYPRKPGVQFATASVGEVGASPFAALGALKKRQ